ncbi:Hypothetical predicted protein, partial [Pelobates cultripes]
GFNTQIQPLFILPPQMTTLLAGVADPTARPNDISNVFSLEPLGCNNPNDINNVFFSIQQLYKLQIKGYWEVTSLRHYLDQKLVPRGLRPEISTPDKVNTEDKLKEWNDILINCSYKLMQFLVKLEEENFEKVNKDLQNEVIKVKEFQSNSEYTLMENKLQNNIDNFTTHIKEKKHYKFQRDYKDFKEGTIFRQTKRSNIRANRKNSYSSGNTEWTDSDSGPTQGEGYETGRDGVQTQPQQPQELDQLDISNMKMINLSNFKLLPDHITLLNKGLSFVPTPSADKFEWLKDINLFGRKLALCSLHKKKNNKEAKELGLTNEDFIHFQTLVQLLTEQETAPPLTSFKPLSWFTPNFRDDINVDLFVKMTTETIESLPTPIIQQNNLSFGEQKAFKDLSNNKNIVIKPSDKGGNIVIMERETYVDMCLIHLNNSSCYRKLGEDPTSSYFKSLRTLLDGATTK